MLNSSLKWSSKVNLLFPSWDPGTSCVEAVRGDGLAATASVAALVSVSWCPRSSVKVTLTLTLCPCSLDGESVAGPGGFGDIGSFGAIHW